MTEAESRKIRVNIKVKLVISCLLFAFLIIAALAPVLCFSSRSLIVTAGVVYDASQINAVIREHLLRIIVPAGIIAAVLAFLYLLFICKNITDPVKLTSDVIRFVQKIEGESSLNSLEKILNGLDVIICVTDPETDDILFINNSMKENFNVDNSCLGSKCYRVFQNLDERCSFCPCRILSKNPDEVVVWEEHHSRTNRIYRSCSRYINWPDGRKVHLEHSIDITAHIESKREIAEKNELLQEALQKAETASNAKSAFLANMSHEIRTPMNAILGITEIQLRDETLPPETAEGLEKIYDSGNLLLNIINDILDLSKIEAGKLEIIPADYDIPNMIIGIVQMNRLRHDSKQIVFSLDVDEKTPLNLFGDELRLKQIACNILSNALKYTDRGEVRMTIFTEEQNPQDDNVMLVFRISDTGQGMTQEQLDRLYDEYTRFNMDFNRTTVGTGLGMSITKRLVDLMNGEITVQSEPNRGTVFTVKLPQKKAGLLLCGKETVEKLRDFSFHSTSMSKKNRMLHEIIPSYGSILIVDDVETNIYVTKGMLLPYGLKIDTAVSGFEAIEKIKAGNVYDIIFMDHMMPGMDGIETVRIIRNMKYKNNIIALTANALVGQAEIFLKNGFNGYISKPIDSRELNKLLNQFIINGIKHNPYKSEQMANGSSEVLRFFKKDAENAIVVFEDFSAKITDSDSEKIGDAEIDSFEITVHGIKSALANIGEPQLSDFAKKLENAAKEKNLDLIAQEIHVFIDEIKALLKKQTYADKLKTDSLTGSDLLLLQEKLKKIKTACETFDSNTARNALDELIQTQWPIEINEILDEINVHLLHSSFKKAAASIETALEAVK